MTWPCNFPSSKFDLTVLNEEMKDFHKLFAYLSGYFFSKVKFIYSEKATKF